MSPAPAAGAAPAVNPWLVAVSVMLATFMEVLDTSVANVSLPHIAGSLAASTEESLWVLTSYLVANAIILPAAGWLAGTFGRKRLLITCVSIFTIASLAAGAATSLGMIVVARILQGLGGGALQPLAQAVLLESFPPAKRGAAMAVYGMGVVVAPIIGPTLGGWITDNYTWRWIFYINLPVGLLAVLMARAFVEDPPYLKPTKGLRMDYLGFGFMAIGLAALQVMLDKGQEEDWFSSHFIQALAFITVVGLLAFVVRELLTAHPIVDLKIFKDRNFALGTLLIAAVGLVLYGTTALLPLFLQTLMGYPALESGLAVSPRGIGSLVAMIFVGRLIGRVSTRSLLTFGFCLLAYATYRFGELNLGIDMRSIAVPNILTGFALGFIFVPLTTTTMGTLPNEQMRNATGIYNLLRNIGGSVGIAVTTSLVTRRGQQFQSDLSRNFTASSPVFQDRLHTLAVALAHSVGAPQALRQAYGVLYGELSQQASLMAYMSIFRLLCILCIICLPSVWIFKAVRAKKGAIHAE